MQTSEWKMPKPNMGDVVLFSLDRIHFTNPCVGWVMKEPGDTTIHILTFTSANGWLERPSVHHRSDPSLSEDNGWEGLGVWDLTDTAKAALKPKSAIPEVRQVGREAVTAK